MGLLLIVVGITLSIVAYLLRRGRWWRRIAAVTLGFVAVIVLAAGGYWSWFTLRPQPVGVKEEWAAGITYERQVMTSPRPMVVHLVQVNLDAGLRLVLPVPEGNVDRPWIARTTSSFARRHDVLLAINASYFFPFRADSPLSYEPREGDAVQCVGFMAHNGEVLQSQRWREAILYIDWDGRPSFATPTLLVSAVSGSHFLLRDGEICDTGDDIEPLYPRTAIGLDKGERVLFMLVVEGKQPGYSEGATLQETGAILRRAGAATAINFDGGGSSTMVRKAEGGVWRLVNGTSNFRMPFWERPVANHLGVKSR